MTALAAHTRWLAGNARQPVPSEAKA